MSHRKAVLVVVVNQVNKNQVGSSSNTRLFDGKIFIIEKAKTLGHEQSTARKSQDISGVIETEKIATKKSIYLKAAEFLLKYNVATVS